MAEKEPGIGEGWETSGVRPWHIPFVHCHELQYGKLHLHFRYELVMPRALLSSNMLLVNP